MQFFKKTKSYRQKFLIGFAIFFIAFLVVPSLVSAASILSPYWGPIVSCSGAPAPGSALPQCKSFCDLLDTGQNTLKMALTFALYVVAPTLFVWGGFLILTAGGSPEKVKEARGILLNIAIGIAVVLGAFVIVNTFFYSFSIVFQGPGGGTGQSSWSEIKCTVAPQDDTNAGGVADGTVGGGATSTCSVSALTPITSLSAQAQEMESGNNKIWSSSDTNVQRNLDKLQIEFGKLKALGQSANPKWNVVENSIYRPLDYQQHLYEIYDRHNKLASLTGDAKTACADLDAKVLAEEQKHTICRGSRSRSCQVSPPSGCAPHVKGVGIDITINEVQYGVINELMTEAGIDLQWASIDEDIVHFNLKNPPFAGCATK